MCGGDDQLVWKHPVPWRRPEGCVPSDGLHSYTWVHMWTFRAAVVTVRFSYALHSLILEAIASFDQMIDGQQAQQIPPQDGAHHTSATLLAVVAPILASKDAHTSMDGLEQRMRQMRISDGAINWDDFDGAPMASLSTQFRMLEIERYRSIDCPKIHLMLYNTVMRAHGLDEAQLIMLFPMSLSGAA
ncbi:hypothetical protein CK203_091935 [Vitis vinifera]|uniref:Uncharacterized protein n=1 Tax=Vitis vinifera TaxID=29760 RepID=A0A438BRK1_VITVI|nr:hypothetical protein CK203_091935 [Vitis vinifera]